MPVALLPALAAIGITGATAVAVSTIIVSVLVNVVLMKIEELFIPKQNSGAGGSPPPPINTTSRATVEFRRLLFGTIRAGGALVFYRTSGSGNQYLWYVVAYAGHQCSAVGDAYIDSRKVPLADINGSTGLVSTAAFNSKLYIATHLGTGAQTTDTWLNTDFASIFDSNHRLRGTCYRVYRMERDDKAWPNGAPGSCTSVVDGALLYDPRLDSTNGGSGAHRRTDPSTWTFSHNPALAVRWFVSGGSVVNDQSTRIIKYGLREVDTRIDDTYTRAAAALCDESIAGANAPPGGAEIRYACDIEVTCGQMRRDILTELLATMGPGQLAYVHGTWRIYAAAYDAPVHDFDQNDLYGEMEIQDTSSASDRFNAVCGVYVDKLQGYINATTIFRTQTAYETQDGGERIPKTLPLRGVTSPYQAQRICELVMRGSRYMRTVKFRFRRGGMKVANWEMFTFSHSRYGWTDRVFRCISRELEYQDDGGVLAVITAKQDDAAVYTDILTADYLTGTSITHAIQSDLPDAPLSLTTIALGGQNIRLEWTLAPFWDLNGISEIWEYTAATPFSSATRVWQGRGTTAVLTKGDTTTRYYWVRVRTIGNQVGDHYPATNGVAGTAGQVNTADIAGLAVSQTLTSFDNGGGGGVTQSCDLYSGGVGTPGVVLTVPTQTAESISITTQGGPIGIKVQTSYTNGSNTSQKDTRLKVQRGGSDLGSGGYYEDLSRNNMHSGYSDIFAPVTLEAIDTPGAGTYTYTFFGTLTGPEAGGSLGATFLHIGTTTFTLREYKK